MINIMSRGERSQEEGELMVKRSLLTLVRKDLRSIWNRLYSILSDANALSQGLGEPSPFPIVANERCGGWYVNRNAQNQTFSAYFMSKDGHHGQWSFSLKRLNLHLFPCIVQGGGLIVVDSTRNGKRIPDALSKTLPIWCCVWNRAIARYRSIHSSTSDHPRDVAFYSSPLAVSPSEDAQIEARIDGFVDALLACPVDFASLAQSLHKPLRPFWLTPSSNLDMVETLRTMTHVYPIICYSASLAVPDGSERRVGYTYIQGAADDEEAWSLGLTSRLFWSHREDIMARPNPSSMEEYIKELVAIETKIDAADNRNCILGWVTNLLALGLYTGNIAQNNLNSCQHIFCVSDHVQDSTPSGASDSSQVVHLSIQGGKRGSLYDHIPKVLDQVKAKLYKGEKVLICSAIEGDPIPVALLLCILLQFYDSACYGLFLPGVSPCFASKREIDNRLIILQSRFPSLRLPTLSRSYMKMIYRFFLKSEF